MDAAEAAVEEARAAEPHTLVMGMSTSPGHGLVPALRTRLVFRYPHAQPVLRQVNWADPVPGWRTDPAMSPSSGCRCRTATVTGMRLVAQEPRLVALAQGHRLAARAAADSEGAVDFTDLFDEPFLALPSEAGPLRDHWLALDARDDHAPRMGGVVGSAEETHEAVAHGQGVVLLATGNASLVVRDEVIAVPVRGISPSCLAVAARRDDERPLVVAYLAAAAVDGALEPSGRSAGRACRDRYRPSVW